MCSTCGCNQPDGIRIQKIGEPEGVEFMLADGSTADLHSHAHNLDSHQHTHAHSHDHPHHHGDSHTHDHPHTHTHEDDTGTSRIIQLEKDILNENKLLAERNRGFMEARRIFAINMVSSPGSGKTTLLERILKDMGEKTAFFVIEGDQQSTRDADRIAETGMPVVQINTGKGCHLDASMVQRAMRKLNPSERSILVIENVGNLVCPSLFDLGENKRVVIMSVTEGDDKPLKYPDMFATSHLCIINKTDLLPYVQFDVDKAKENALRVNHHLSFIETSATTGAGMEKLYQWLGSQLNEIS